MLQTRIQETPRQRNRRLLMQAWDRGVRITSHWGGRYNVTSGSEAGKEHEVMVWFDSDGNKHETCSCAFAAKRGDVVTFNAGTTAQHRAGVPCSHVLIVRWARLSADARALLLTDPEFAAAYEGRGQLAEVA